MRLRRLLGIVIVIASIAAVVLWQRAEIMAFGAQNPLALPAGLAAAAIVLIAAVMYLGAGLRHQRMLLREARRVATMNASVPAPASPAAQTPASEPATAPRQPALLSLLGTIEEVESRRRDGQTADTGAPAQTRLTPQLYYQPVVDLGAATVHGYDVFRKVAMRNLLAEPGFVQRSSAASVAERAAFEFAMIDTALAAARQVFSEAATEGGMLYVHVTDALMDNDRLWTKLALLMRAHPSLSAQITLCVADTALAEPPAARLDAIDQMLDADAGLGIAGLDLPAGALPEYVSRALQIAMYAMDDVREVEPDLAARRLGCLNRLSGLGVAACARGLASDADVVDAVEQGARFGTGPVYAEPMRLRDEPKTVSGRADPPAG